MSVNKTEYLDLKKLSNYFYYLAGIAVESAAVLMLMAIAFLISAIGLRFL